VRKSARRAALAGLVASVVLSVAAPGGAEPEAPYEPPTSASTTTSTTTGAARAGVVAAATTRSYTFTDPSRPTPCAGTATRSLPVTVVHPATGTGFPVVIVGPGTGFSQRTAARTEAERLADLGYFAVALVFPCSNATGASLTDITTLLDYYRQPGDASFVLSALLAKSATVGDELEGLMDPARIGFKGYSGGAVTGLLLFNSCCSDPRIRAVVAVKGFPPPTGPGLPASGTYNFASGTPLFMLNACDDPIIPYGPALEAFLRAAAPRFFTQQLTGSHASPPVLAPDTYPGFLARYVSSDGSAGPLGVLVGATADPSFAYDFGASGPVARTTLPPCVSFTG